MSNTEFTGYLIVYGLVLLGGLIAVIKPIVSLNVNIQKLSDAIASLNLSFNDIKSEIDKHDEKLNDHETRLTIIEKWRVTEMKKIDWVRKLTSRKFWVTLVSFVTAILLYFHVDRGSVEQITTIIMSFATLISYILAEGFIDGNNTGNGGNIND